MASASALIRSTHGARRLRERRAIIAEADPELVELAEPLRSVDGQDAHLRGVDGLGVEPAADVGVRHLPRICAPSVR
jgi:hypothetical protein